MTAPPLGELYDLLRADGFEIGTYDHVRIGRLVAVEGAWTLETLRIAIASLVVREQRDRARFDACWTRWLASTPAAPTAPAPSPLTAIQPIREARYYPWIGLAAALLLLGGGAWWLLLRRPAEVPPAPTAPLVTVVTDAAPDVTTDAPPDAPDPTLIAGNDPSASTLEPAAPPDAGVAPPDAAPPPLDLPEPAPVVAAPPRDEGLPWHAVVAALAGLALAAVTFVLQRRWARRERRFVPGPWRYPLQIAAGRPVLPRTAVEDAAGDMTWQSDAAGHDLDLRRTVDRTVAAGGMPTLVYRPPPAAPEYLVLEDVSRGAARWRFVYDELWRSLSREGVRIARYTFDADLERCTAADGKPVALRDLLEHADAMIVIGDGASAVDPLTGEPAEWLDALRAIPRRLWINPLPPSRWPAATSAITRDTPMEHGATRALAMLRAGASRREHPARPFPAIVERAPATDSGYAALRAHLGEPAFQLQAAVATAGAPSIVAARWLAEQLDVTLDETEWLGLATLPWFETERWPATLQERLVATLAAESPALAREVATLADRALVASEPARGTGAHLKWELDVASRRIERGDRGGLVAAARLASSPLALEVRQRLRALGARDRRHPLLAALAFTAVALVALGVEAWTAPVTVAVPPRAEAVVERPFLPSYAEPAGTLGERRVFIERITTTQPTADRTRIEVLVDSYDATTRGALEFRDWQLSDGRDLIPARRIGDEPVVLVAEVDSTTLPQQLAVAALQPARAITVTSRWRAVPAPPPAEVLPPWARAALRILAIVASAVALSQLLLALFALSSPRRRHAVVALYVGALLALGLAGLIARPPAPLPIDVPGPIADPAVTLAVVSPVNDPAGAPGIVATIADPGGQPAPSAVTLRDLASGAMVRGSTVRAVADRFEVAFSGEGLAWDGARHELMLAIDGERLPPVTLRLLPAWRSADAPAWQLALLGAVALLLAGTSIALRRRRAFAAVALLGAVGAAIAAGWLLWRDAAPTVVEPLDAEIAGASATLRSIATDPHEPPMIEAVVQGMPRSAGFEAISLVDLATGTSAPATHLRSYVEGGEPLALAFVVVSGSNLVGNPAEVVYGRTNVGVFDEVARLLDRAATLGPAGSVGIVISAWRSRAPSLRWRGPLRELRGQSLGAQADYAEVTEPPLVPPVALGLDELVRTDAKHKVAIVITDGKDAEPWRARRELVALRRRATALGITIVTIVVEDLFRGSTIDAVQTALPFWRATGAELEATLTSIVAHIAGRFYLTFPAAPFAWDGQPHRYAVKLQRQLVPAAPFTLPHRSAIPWTALAFAGVLGALVGAIATRRRRRVALAFVALAIAAAAIAAWRITTEPSEPAPPTQLAAADLPDAAPAPSDAPLDDAVDVVDAPDLVDADIVDAAVDAGLAPGPSGTGLRGGLAGQRRPKVQPAPADKRQPPVDQSRAGGVYVQLGTMSEQPGSDDATLSTTMTEAAARGFGSAGAGITLQWPGGGAPPDATTARGILKKLQMTGFHVTGKLELLETQIAMGKDSSTTVRCKLSLTVSTFPDRAVVSVTNGSASAVSDPADSAVTKAQRDCISSVIESLIAKQVVSAIRSRSSKAGGLIDY